MLKTETHQDGPSLTLKMSGAISEESDLPTLSETVKGELILDLEGISAINSVGCRNWALWMRELKAGNGIILKRCSPVFVHQMNVLVGFIGQAKVASVFVPYYCASCGGVKNELVEFANGHVEASNLNIATTIPCPVCKSKMEIDVDEGRFFSFLSRGK